MPYQVRDVEQVVADFQADGQPYGVFIDNNLGSRPDYLRALCRALRPLEVIWSAAVTIDVTDDPTLVREMAMAGCTGVFVGFESLAGENLDDANKKTPRPEDYARRVAILHDHGIQVNGSFVLGFDRDRLDVFERTVAWIEAARLECATFHILTPYPGTPLFRQMESQGRLLHKDWRLYDTAHAVFRPRNMTPEELEDGIFLVLPSPILAPLDLASPACRLAGCAPVPGDVVSLQTVKPSMESLDQAPAHGSGLASPGRVNAMAASALSAAVGTWTRCAGTGG